MPLHTPSLTGAFIRVHAANTAQTWGDGGGLVDFNTLDAGTGNAALFSSDLAANTVTVLRTGRYQVSWCLTMRDGSTGQRLAILRVNTAGLRISGAEIGTKVIATGSETLQLTAGDVLDLFGYVDGGGTVTVASGNLWETGLTVAYLGT